MKYKYYDPSSHISMTPVVTCIECEFPFVQVLPEKKYNGLRGRCPKCGVDWPES